MKKVLVIVGSGILLLILGGALVFFLIDSAIVEEYSPSWTSYSIEEAKKNGVFISQPVLENNTIELNGFKYPIREAWIERSTRIEYKWIFIRQRIPTGYRIILTLTVPFDSPEDKNLATQAAVMFPKCNDAIWLTAIVPAVQKDMWLYYCQVGEPFPQSVRLAFKEYR